MTGEELNRVAVSPWLGALRALCALGALGALGVTGCTLNFPGAASQEYPCRESYDCVSGWTCIEHVCSNGTSGDHHSTEGDDQHPQDGGGDNQHPQDGGNPDPADGDGGDGSPFCDEDIACANGDECPDTHVCVESRCVRKCGPRENCRDANPPCECEPDFECNEANHMCLRSFAEGGSCPNNTIQRQSDSVCLPMSDTLDDCEQQCESSPSDDNYGCFYNDETYLCLPCLRTNNGLIVPCDPDLIEAYCRDSACPLSIYQPNAWSYQCGEQELPALVAVCIEFGDDCSCIREETTYERPRCLISVDCGWT